MQRSFGFLLVVLMILTLGRAAPRDQGAPDDKVVFSGEYVLPSGETLTGTLTVLGGRAVIEPDSRVGEDVVLFGGELWLAGTVSGGVTVFGGTITLDETAVIEGDMALFGGRIDQAAGAQVQGDVFTLERAFSDLPIPLLPAQPVDPVPPSVRASTPPLLALLRWQLGTFGLSLLLALLAAIAVLLLPQHMGLVVSASARQPAYSFGIGLLTLVLALLAGGLLLIACGLGLVLWLALLAGLLMGWSGVGIWLGHRLLRMLRVTTPSALVEALLGVFVLTVMARLPLGVGFLVALVAASIGLGAVVVTRFGTRLGEEPGRA